MSRPAAGLPRPVVDVEEAAQDAGSTARGSDPRRALGRLGEELAAAHFGQLGFLQLARNQRTRHGEIDLIVCDSRTLVFAEVKCRRVSARSRGVRPDPEPLAWLRARQRVRLRRLAAAWLRDRSRGRPSAQDIRFDAVGVVVDSDGALVRLDHVEGAW